MKVRTIFAAFMLILLSSCNSPTKNIDKEEQLVDRIVEASKNDDFEAMQLNCDELYSAIRDKNDSNRELYLSYVYFHLCCYNGGSEEDVQMKMELYTGRFVGRSGWDVVKTMDPIWFSNIQRSAELLLRAYEDNPSLTNKMIEENYTLAAFQAFARLVLKNS